MKNVLKNILPFRKKTSKKNRIGISWMLSLAGQIIWRIIMGNWFCWRQKIQIELICFQIKISTKSMELIFWILLGKIGRRILRLLLSKILCVLCENLCALYCKNLTAKVAEVFAKGTKMHNETANIFFTILYAYNPIPEWKNLYSFFSLAFLFQLQMLSSFLFSR